MVLLDFAGFWMFSGGGGSKTKENQHRTMEKSLFFHGLGGFSRFSGGEGPKSKKIIRSHQSKPYQNHKKSIKHTVFYVFFFFFNGLVMVLSRSAIYGFFMVVLWFLNGFAGFCWINVPELRRKCSESVPNVY